MVTTAMFLNKMCHILCLLNISLNGLAPTKWYISWLLGLFQIQIRMITKNGWHWRLTLR